MPLIGQSKHFHFPSRGKGAEINLGQGYSVGFICQENELYRVPNNIKWNITKKSLKFTATLVTNGTISYTKNLQETSEFTLHILEVSH